MPRITPLSRESLADYEPVWQTVEAHMGFVPNSMLTLARNPEILNAIGQLAFQITAPAGRLTTAFKQMIGHVASRSAGCGYCMAHSAALVDRAGEETAKIDALWDFERSDLFTDGEKAAFRVAQGAAQVPNAVTDADFDALKAHFSDDEIVEIIAVIAMFGFLNRWNDTMATELESDPAQFAKARLAPHGWSGEKHLKS